jgi:protein involved in polysaccharide export with SLBB domain
MGNHTLKSLIVPVLAATLLSIGGGLDAGLAQASVPSEGIQTGAIARPAPDALEGTLDPELYFLGPGDVLQIGFWGDVNRQEIVTVNPDGDILVPPVGPIRVAGKSLAEIREIVKSRLSVYYRPSILSVSVVSLRTFQVHVVGLVESPGAIEANGVTRVSQAIGMAEGVLDGGSMRNIMVRRGSGAYRADLTGYLYIGDNAFNPFLQDGDVIYVPARGGMVHIYGSVGRPGDYEFVEGETVAELVRLAGGMRPEAYTEEIELERFEPEDSSRSTPIFLEGGQASLAGFEIKMGDRVFVRSIPDWQRDAKVQIVGEVKFPGLYVIEEGRETLTSIIAKAGGFTEHASLAEARLVRNAYAVGTHPIEREMGVLGEMQDSFGEEERDLLKTMGRETKGRLAIRFDEIFLEPGSAEDPLLYDMDVIEVPRASNSIRVAGQVKNPGLVAIAEGQGYSYYIRAAGGYAPKADRRSTTLIRAASGVRVDPWDEKVGPGDIIWVPARLERDWWQVTKDVLALAAQIATIWLVVDTTSGK